MGTENTVYKGKSLHVHSNNKNHVLENRNGKHTHCFMTYLNKNKNKIKIKYTQIYGLTPKRHKPFFSKKHSKLPFLAQEAQMKIKIKICIFNHKILP
jgi:hypothetical protein